MGGPHCPKDDSTPHLPAANAILSVFNNGGISTRLARPNCTWSLEQRAGGSQRTPKSKASPSWQSVLPQQSRRPGRFSLLKSQPVETTLSKQIAK
jgi:hypothetical protein